MNINLTENSFIYQSAKRLLEKELDKCFKLLKETENVTDLVFDLAQLEYISSAGLRVLLQLQKMMKTL